MATWSCGRLSGLDESSSLHPQDSTLWHLHRHVHGYPTDVPHVFAGLLPLRCCLLPGLLHAYAEHGESF